jgi:hypothetical protein
MSDPRYPIGRFTPPAEYTADARRDFIAHIVGLPTLLTESVSGLDESQLETPYRDGGWTVAQVVHHMADSHMQAYSRFKLALTEANPTIKPYNEAAWAALPDGSTTDIDDSLGLLEGLHGRWTVLLRHMAPAEFERPFQHPERGPMTLDRALALYAWHGRHHVAHITTLRERMNW